MGINNDKTHLWKQDTDKSVDLFNRWFLRFAPKAYRDNRIQTTRNVEVALRLTGDLLRISSADLRANPRVLPTLRMSTSPALAQDRLMGLAHVSKTLIERMEEGRLPVRMAPNVLNAQLASISRVIDKMLDKDIFPWLVSRTRPTPIQRRRASTIIADRLCGTITDPIIRNAQEKRQLAYIARFLRAKGYRQVQLSPTVPLSSMAAGTYSFRTNVRVGSIRAVNIPIDVVIQPRTLRPNRLPVLVEAKSAGDFTNVNKRRKEEGIKAQQLRAKFGPGVQFILFLCGYFDGGYLGYEATEGIDWVWEHRIEDFNKLGL